MRPRPDTLHGTRVQETTTIPEPDNPLLALSLDEVEEAGGEIHRRLATAFRLLGEEHADRAEPGERTARWHVASLIAMTELAAHTLGAIAAGTSQVTAPRLDRHAATIAAVMYAAPTIPALASLLEHDRRRTASLARTLEDQLDEPYATPFGTTSLRGLLASVCVAEPARCALLLERLAPPTAL